MIKAAVVIIGDEILLGRVNDTNSGYIARTLDPKGVKIEKISVVGDNEDDIRQAVTAAIRKYQLVFTTGGLGPTKDDITKKVLTKIFGGELVRDNNVTANIEQIFANRGLQLNQLTLDQALVPTSAHVVQNRFGTAPILIFEKEGHFLACLPGVPYEMENMLAEVTDYLSKKLNFGLHARHTTRLVAGLSESALAQELSAFEESLPEGYKLAYLPDSPLITLRLDCYDGDSRFDEVADRLDSDLKGIEKLVVLATEETSLAKTVIAKLESLNLSLCTAESCTGGNIAHFITSVEGASEVYKGSVVSYANSAKVDLLDVGEETLATNGAVSRPVVIQMASGATRAFEADCCIATSGIAGPGGGTPDKPVGTVWICVKTPKGVTAECHRFRGNRQRVIESATKAGIISLLKELSQI